MILVLKLQSENQSFVIGKSILRFIADETAKEKIEAAFHEILSAFRLNRNGVWLFVKRGGRGVCYHFEINNQWVNILRLRKRSAEK